MQRWEEMAEEAARLHNQAYKLTQDAQDARCYAHEAFSGSQCCLDLDHEGEHELRLTWMKPVAQEA